MRFGLARAALLIVLAAGCSSEAPGERAGKTSEPIAGGTLDTDHPAVFEEITRWTDTVSTCTASLIAPNVLLTARHCIASSNTEQVVCARSMFGDTVPGSSTIVTPDAVPHETSTFYRGLDVRVPADSNSMCGYDVALIILKTPVPASQVTPLIPRIDRPVELGEGYTAVGYGVDDQGQQNPGRMVLDDLSVQCVSAACLGEFGVAATEFMGDKGICSGDSGGPALDADGKIIGVVSRGSNPCATPIYSQVAPWRDFITQTVLDAAESAGYRAPFWAYSGSSDLPADATGEGEACTDSSACGPGLVCYYEGKPSDAKCTAVCGNSAQCAEGKTCRLGYDVTGGGLCVDAAGSGSGTSAASAKKLNAADQGCSFSPGSRSTGGLGLAAFGSLLALVRLRRTRRTRA